LAITGDIWARSGKNNAISETWMKNAFFDKGFAMLLPIARLGGVQ